MKTCVKCKLLLPITEFWKNHRAADGLMYSCKKCAQIRSSTNYRNTIENRKSYSKRYEIEKRERPASYSVKRKDRFKAYGITKEQYDSMLTEQRNKCKICNEGKKLHIDHCHVTGKVRGLLCQNCNTLLGHAKESNDILLNAVAYLKESKT